jgi:hypothetical protein
MSISLTTTATVSVGGTTIETDANLALTYAEIVFPTSIRLFFNYGTTAAQTFAKGTVVPQIIVTMSLHDGTWTSNNGLSGTALSAGLTSLQTGLLALRNGFETFAINAEGSPPLSIAPGTLSAWTSGMF